MDPVSGNRKNSINISGHHVNWTEIKAKTYQNIKDM